MKKQIVTFFIALFITSFVVAQTKMDKRLENNVNNYLERVEKNTKLTEDEKTKIIEIKKEHTLKIWALTEKYKDNPQDKTEEQRAANKAMNESLMEAFGKKRGREILIASRNKKD